MRPPPPVTALVLALLVSAPTAAKRPMLATAPPPVVLPPLPTANGLHPDLLPADCGRRPVPPPAGHQPQLAGHPVENPAYTGQFPWHVRLVAREPSGHQEHRCSGLIVSQWHVLTAADCVWNTLPSQVFVRVADVRISVIDEGEHDYAVTDIHVHHARDGAKLADNVALLRLAGASPRAGSVRDGDLPWIVVVASDRPPRRPCTGVIVSARWILTAAECAPALTTLEVYPASEYFFRANPDRADTHTAY
ncbi:Ovochymase-2 [Amphibalanus amphitrite]|uniref:Ovochymase-2 n=1 Tax=Amphibalanus amphitrite TaxID=1232801 RepID=A0A6A4WDW6_AMPAM|nr:Ovochymase-2 [Amphibalanus amphitrite]